MENNGSGIDFPTIELNGKTYTVKFSRAMLYRMNKLGVVFAPQIVASPTDPGKKAVQMTFMQIVDVLHLATGYEGSHEELAEAVFDKRPEAIDKLMAAWGKAFPSPQVQLREPAGQPEAPLTQ